MISGIILINKPKDFTSHDVVAKSRRILKTRKIGHSGTLDPMATGVLPIFIGKATKAIDRITNHDKSYTATIKLGITTDTQDITGKILTQNNVNVSKADFYAVLDSFKGVQQQIPPMYSAIQVDGRRLYELARQGVEIKREPRKIEIYNIEAIDESMADNEYKFSADCSKGTYIRTICHDIGEKLGCGAVLTDLVRTSAHGFGIDKTITLEELEEFAGNGSINNHIIKVESLFADFEKILLTGELEKHFLNGVPLWISQLDIEADDQDKAIYDSNNGFIGVAKANKEKSQLTNPRIFI